MFEPSVCVIAQGSKEVHFGSSRYQYNPFHYLLVTVDLPHISQVLEASKEQLYLSLLLSPLLSVRSFIILGWILAPAVVLKSYGLTQERLK